MELGPHAIASLLITLAALLLYTRTRVRLEHSSVAVLFVLVVGFELLPYRGPPVVPEPVRNVAREASPDVTSEVAPGAGPAGAAETARDEEPVNGRGPPAESAEPPGNVVLRGSDFLLNFGNEALITICLLLILAKGVETTGALRPLGRILSRMWFFNRHVAMLVTLAVAALLSAFVNNTPVVVMMLPLLVGVALRAGISPSRMLMPLGFATIIGGMSTTIGTSTNLLVVSVSRKLDGPEFGIFDFALPASIAAAVGILYLWLAAPRFLPDRTSPLVEIEPHFFRAVISIGSDCELVGKTVTEIVGEMEGRIRIQRVERGGVLDLLRVPSMALRAGDLLYAVGPPEMLKKAQSVFQGALEETLHDPDQQLIEVVVTPSSPLHRKRFSEVGHATSGRLSAVGLRPAVPHQESAVITAVNPILDTGDLLLAQGHRDAIRELREDPELLVLDRDVPVARTSKAPMAIGVFLAVVLAAALGIVSIMVSALCGVGLMLLWRCVAWDEAWRAIDTRLALVVVTSLALGTSLSVTGATEFLARSFVAAARDLPPAIILSSLLAVTALLTEVVTNNAIAVIATPIALGIANQLGLPATPFVLAVLFGANMSYMTPIGYQTNLLVLSAGGYRFSDFARIGIPLQLLMWAALSIALPIRYL